MSLKVPLALVVLCLLAAPLFAQTEVPGTGKLQDFDAIPKRALQEWQIPGVSVAVVRDGKVIYAKGFGYRDFAKQLPVTTDTLFAIGSISKSFTSLVFGILNDEGKVDWDTPVRTYIPELQLDDPVANDHATPRDLFSHRTGMAPSDLIWYSSKFSREDIVHRMRYIKFDKEFRRGYEYCNLMFMTMGYLEGRVMNTTWENLVQAKVFDPLGMSHSNFSVTESQKTPDFAQPYELQKDVVNKVPFKNIDTIGPAGSINSSINDMSRYLLLQLGDGTYSGKQIVSQKNLTLMHTGQTAMGSLPAAFSQGGLGPMAYAFGWVDTTYRGHHMVWHNGGIDGFHSLLTMLPDDKTGVVVLSNLGNTMALEAIAYAAFDRLLDLPPYPWFDKFSEIRGEAKKAEEKEKNNPKEKPAKTGTQPSHPLTDFAGLYSNPAFGDIKIAENGGVLNFTLNSLEPVPLNRVHYDIFEVPEAPDGPISGTRFQFLMNKDGDIDRIAGPLSPSLPDDIVFNRTVKK